MTLKHIVVSGAFDNPRSRHLRFLQEASGLGPVTVLLWPDEWAHRLTGQAPRFPLAERAYFLRGVRYVDRVIEAAPAPNANALPALAGLDPGIWVDEESPSNAARQAHCRERGIEYRVLTERDLAGFPEPAAASFEPGRKKVIVTGCYDWLHTGHVRFFEEVSAYGELVAVVGNDVNIRSLKGEGHPLIGERERRYLVGSIRFVKQALIATGMGWVDADPEIRRLKPDIYAVNEDGDRGGKREYCRERGLEYLVLKRTPAPGLPPRSSTALRGF
jgi:cytidyltransferase-like protein